MHGTLINLNWRFAVLTVVLFGAAIGLNHLAGLGRAREIFIAGTRAIFQLAAISLIIVWVLREWWSTIAFLILMMVVAAITSSGRLEGTWKYWHVTLIPVMCGIIPTVALILASGAIPLRPIAVLPICGILIGNAMTSTTLAGKRIMEELEIRHGEVDAGLSIGLLERDAIQLVAKQASTLALIPALDQAKTVGLVTLPGAFIGILLGGGGPLQAGAGQLLVLAGIQLVQTITTSVTLELASTKKLPTRFEHRTGPK